MGREREEPNSRVVRPLRGGVITIHRFIDFISGGGQAARDVNCFSFSLRRYRGEGRAVAAAMLCPSDYTDRSLHIYLGRRFTYVHSLRSSGLKTMWATYTQLITGSTKLSRMSMFLSTPRSHPYLSIDTSPCVPIRFRNDRLHPLRAGAAIDYTSDNFKLTIVSLVKDVLPTALNCHTHKYCSRGATSYVLRISI